MCTYPSRTIFETEIAIDIGAEKEIDEGGAKEIETETETEVEK
jgi:hypothetical protein